MVGLYLKGVVVVMSQENYHLTHVVRAVLLKSTQHAHNYTFLIYCHCSYDFQQLQSAVFS